MLRTLVKCSNISFKANLVLVSRGVILTLSIKSVYWGNFKDAAGKDQI